MPSPMISTGIMTETVRQMDRSQTAAMPQVESPSDPAFRPLTMNLRSGANQVRPSVAIATAACSAVGSSVLRKVM